MQTKKFLSNDEFQIELLKFMKDISSTLHSDRMTPTHELDYIDNADLLRRLNISHGTAKNWRKRGILVFYKLGRKIYYRISDIERLFKRAINKRK